MHVNESLLDIFTCLQSEKLLVLTRTLKRFLSICTCESHALSTTAPKCPVIAFVEQSPVCIEFFHICGAIDPVVLSTLKDLGILQRNARFTFNEETPGGPTRAHVAGTLGDLVCSCFSVILRHNQLDTGALVTQESRVTIASRLLRCLRFVYRLFHVIQSTDTHFYGISRMLNALTLVSDSITSQFLTLFDFKHALLSRVLTLQGCSATQLNQALRSRQDVFPLGVLGLSWSDTQHSRRQSRQELVEMGVNLLGSRHVSQIIKKKAFILKILKFLAFDPPESSHLVVTRITAYVLHSTVLSTKEKFGFFSLDIMASLGTLFAFYGILNHIWDGVLPQRHSVNTHHREKAVGSETDDLHGDEKEKQRNRVRSVNETVDVLQSLLRGVCCLNSSSTERCLSVKKLLLEFPVWLQCLFFPHQQQLFLDLLATHKGLADDMIHKFTTDAVCHRLFFSCPLQPRKTALWIRYMLFYFKLLCTEVTPRSLLRDSAWDEHKSLVDSPQGYSNVEFNGSLLPTLMSTNESSQDRHDSSSKDGSWAKSEWDPLKVDTLVETIVSQRFKEYEKNFFCGPSSLTVFPDSNDKSLLLETTWDAVLQKIQTTSHMTSHVLSTVLLGPSRLFQSHILTSILLHSSAAVVFVGLKLITALLDRVRRFKEQFPETLALHVLIDRTVVARLPDTSTIIQLYSRFSERSYQETSVRFGGCSTRNADADNNDADENDAVPFDLQCNEAPQDTQINTDIELPTVQCAPPSLLDEAHQSTLTVSSHIFSLKQLLCEFDGPQPSCANIPYDNLDLFSTWCTTVEKLFRTVRVDGSITKFDWSQILDVPFLQPDRLLNANHTHCASLALQQLYALQLLDAVWELNCFSTDPEQSGCFQHVSPGYLKAYMNWFERLLLLFAWSLKNPLWNLLDGHVTVENAVYRFLRQSGILHYGKGHCEAELWLELLKTKLREHDTPEAYWRLFCDLFRNVNMFFAECYAAYRVYYDAWRQKHHKDNHDEVPLSLFSSCVVFKCWAVSPPEIPSRCFYLHHLYSQRRVVAQVTHDLPTQTLQMGLELCQWVCDALVQVARQGGRSTSIFLRFLVSQQSWKNVFQRPTTSTMIDGSIVSDLRLRLDGCVKKLMKSLKDVPGREEKRGPRAEGEHSKDKQNTHTTIVDTTLSREDHVDRGVSQDVAILPQDSVDGEEIQRVWYNVSTLLENYSSGSLQRVLHKGGFSSVERLLGLLDTSRNLGDILKRSDAQSVLDNIGAFCMDMSRVEERHTLPHTVLVLKTLLLYVSVQNRAISLISVNKDGKKSWSRVRDRRQEKLIHRVMAFHLCPYTRMSVEEYFMMPWQSGVVRAENPLTECQVAVLTFLVLTKYLLCSLHDVDKETNYDDQLLPLSWVECFVAGYYCASMSSTDQLIRLLIQRPEHYTDVPLENWVGHQYNFHDCTVEFTGCSVVRRSTPFNWLEMSSTRRAFTLDHFPFNQKFHVMDHSFDDIALNLTRLTTSRDSTCFLSLWSSFSAAREAQVTAEEHLTQSVTYDPAYVFPFLLSRFRAAWFAMHADPQQRTLTMESLAQSSADHNVCPTQSTAVELSHEQKDYQFAMNTLSVSLDTEGVWLRRIASGGALQLLLIGLACTDAVIASAAQQSLALYRHLLITAEKQAQQRALKRRSKRVWKMAARQCRQELRGKTSCGRRQAKHMRLEEEVIRVTYKELLNNQPLKVHHCFREAPEVLTLLELVRNAIILKGDSPMFELSSPVTAFAASCVHILMDCTHPLYGVINKYLLSRPLLLTDNLPMFLSNYWSARLHVWANEIHFSFQVLQRAVGSYRVDVMNCTDDDVIASRFWNLLNTIGSLPLILKHVSLVKYRGSEEISRTSMVEWNAVLKVLLRLTKHTQYAMWLAHQYGLLEWIEHQVLVLFDDITNQQSGFHSDTLSKDNMLMLFMDSMQQVISLRALLFHMLTACSTTADSLTPSAPLKDEPMVWKDEPMVWKDEPMVWKDEPMVWKDDKEQEFATTQQHHVITIRVSVKRTTLYLLKWIDAIYQEISSRTLQDFGVTEFPNALCDHLSNKVCIGVYG